jgi:hypothetical protein
LGVLAWKVRGLLTRRFWRSADLDVQLTTLSLSLATPQTLHSQQSHSLHSFKDVSSSSTAPTMGDRSQQSSTCEAKINRNPRSARIQRRNFRKQGLSINLSWLLSLFTPHPNSNPATSSASFFLLLLTYSTYRNKSLPLQKPLSARPPQPKKWTRSSSKRPGKWPSHQ